MEQQVEMAATSFRVMVSEAEPYSFQTFAAQQTQDSVRITHITFTPPSPEELEAYVQHQRRIASATSTGTATAAVCPATFALLRTLCATRKVESHTIACFPWSQPDEATTAKMRPHGNNNKNKGKGNKKKTGVAVLPQSTTAAAHPVEEVQLGGLFDVALPRQTDICSNVDLRFDVDGSVWLEVVGPGRVTFFGEQNSSLIPEWMEERFFNFGANNEESSEDDNAEEEEDEVAAM
ncbi:uncharacterized protein Tco025E_05028 [Trypanosoma conorhini]|uniref:Uncharacterized protein n=1 Tax=Trypanosoma conorhini TaxID=83891 RepID=A0A3R7MKV9_9TRYP|nr:uncharacterized protein Tco025E_05028 [Trypanosoma conorhini]RNF16831.1 hypothetical protein Tco025E_05028 [Trypanosoma conorhini]